MWKRGLVLLALAAPAFAQDLSVAPQLFARVHELGRPDWIQPGYRFTYFTSSAIVRDHPTEIYLDHNNRRRTRPSGSGGMGFLQVDVVGVGPQAVAINVRAFSLTGAQESGPAKLGTQFGLVGAPASVGDYWVHPQALAAARIGTQAVGGVTTNVLRTIHVGKNQKKYEATRADQSKGKDEKQSWVWDNRSGVLLFISTLTRVPEINTNRRYATAGKSTGQMHYRSARRLKLPWAGSPMPGWLKQVKRMDFLGTTTTKMPGSMPVEMPRAMRYDFTGPGPSWTKIKVTSVNGGLSDLDPGTAGIFEGASRSETEVCTGPGMIGGAWLPPAGIKQLQAGQAIDKDPFTQVATTVTHVGLLDGRNVVVITEEHALQRLDYHYDLRSGGLMRLRWIDRQFHMDTLLRLHSTK